ncbi:unnamed protein product [Thlaspi arvense]|uniref:non-specific serine/threonine protein kinase n=1 Tax=Thlaspi arvense TaxID=13288 RepID=A0AAU9SMR5_THLAR|nr:unnamed protein product [Thlaspi arvense]
MSDSPASSPPAPSADSAPPPDNSTGGSAPPPADSAPPPSPPADSTPPPVSSPPPSLPSPPPATPPPESNPPPPLPVSSPPPPPDAPPPADPPPVVSASPPPEPTNSPPPPPEETFESPPPPPNEDDSPPAPPPPEILSPPPASSPKGGPKKPKKTPPPSAPTKSPSAPAESPPAPPNAPPRNTSHALPPRSTAAGGPLKSPSRGAPSVGGSVPPPPNEGGYEGKTMAGMAVAGFAIIALIAVVFIVRRKKKRNVDAYSDSQYLPPSNFSIKSDGFLYGQNPSKGYSGPGGSMYNTQQQQQSNTGNSFGSQRGSQRGYTQSGSTPDSAVMGSGQTHFTYEELMDITEGFAKRNILGEGGFGCVYKGKLHDGKLVAVKQLKVGSGQGDREFKAEVEIISRVHHRHLVSLVGYCISDVERLLIYEYVPNQTLEHHLHGKGRPVLEWARRVRIAIGSAKGLAYLHEDCKFLIWRVADFGLAKLNDSTQTHVSTRVMGTFGYLAPEYAQSGKLTDRSDVFSFGVVLLELITGRKPVDQYQPLGEESLVEWARPLLHKAIETGDFSDLVDRRLEKHYVENEVFRMIETAAACVRHSGPKRPRMVQVVRALDSEGDMGDISNGNKVGQSSSYDSDVMKFRKMAFGFDDSSDSGMHSGDYSVQSSRRGSNGASGEFMRNESENRNFNNRRF